MADAVAAALAAAKMRAEKAKALSSTPSPKTPLTKPGTSRSFSRGANSPSEVHELAAAARSGERKSQKMQVLFEQWLSASEDWSESTLVLSMRHSHTHTKRGSRRWMTRGDLLEKYKNDETIVDEIIGEKERDSGTKTACCRAHPDAPNNAKLRQYLCYDEETEADSEDVVLTSLFECKDSGKTKKKKDKKRKRSTSSSTSTLSSSDSEESSSDSGNKKSKKKKKNDKKSKKGKKGKSSKGKGKKDKKKSKADKQKDKERRDKQELKEKERLAEKANQDSRTKAKKVLNALQSSISDAAKREVKAKKMSPGIQEVVLKELRSLKAKMAEQRDALQSIIDGDKVDRMNGAAEAGDAALKHYNSNKPAA